MAKKNIITQVIYPVGPAPPVTQAPKDLHMLPGEGINAPPFECEKIVDLTFAFGKGSDLMTGLAFQLGRWGYDTTKMDESIEVSPQFTEYYNKVIMEKDRIGTQIKNGLISVSKASEDVELIAHDVRKYAEYMDYFKEWKLAQANEDKEGERKAMHTIRAMFVDTIDIHTGEGVSLRSIAPRWSTIIADFLALSDDDDTPEKIQKSLGITKAEAVILTTKNKLFMEWRDRLFLPTVTKRYQRLVRVLEIRKKSLNEYLADIKPLVSRYKAIREMRELKSGRETLSNLAWYHPHAQAMSIDFYKIWAWKPFAIEEVFKASRESYTSYTFKEAGFNVEEIKELRASGKSDVPALPVKPIVDKWVRKIIEQIEAVYGVKITAEDIYKVIAELNVHYRHPVRSAEATATAKGFRWVFSPYFIFVELPITKTVIKSPDGSLCEDIWIEVMKSWNCTQNIVIGRLLEREARNKRDEQEISQYVGEIADVEGALKKTDDVLKERYPHFYLTEEEKKEKPSLLKNVEKTKETISEGKERIKELREGIAKFVNTFGIRLMFAYPGPYEKMMKERMTKMMQRAPGIAFRDIDLWLKSKSGVPSSVDIEYR